MRTVRRPVPHLNPYKLAYLGTYLGAYIVTNDGSANNRCTYNIALLGSFFGTDIFTDIQRTDGDTYSGTDGDTVRFAERRAVVISDNCPVNDAYLGANFTVRTGRLRRAERSAGGVRLRELLLEGWAANLGLGRIKGDDLGVRRAICALCLSAPPLPTPGVGANMRG